MLNLDGVNWKTAARIIGLILLGTCVSNLAHYWQNRYSFMSDMIPEEILVRIAKPYLIGFFVLVAFVVISGIFLYRKNDKVSTIISVVALIFNFVNQNFIGEYWSGPIK